MPDPTQPPVPPSDHGAVPPAHPSGPPTPVHGYPAVGAPIGGPVPGPATGSYGPPKPPPPPPSAIIPAVAAEAAPAQGHTKDHRLDKLGWIVGGAIVSAIIAAGGWLGGMLYERLEKAEDKIVALEKENLEQKHQIEALQEKVQKLDDRPDHASEIKSLKEQTQRQWQVISEVKATVAGHNH